MLVILCLPLLTLAFPHKIRAGGPAVVPIPKNCTIINPPPHAHCGHANVNGYEPSSTFMNSKTLYSAYFTDTLSPSKQATQCFEQCYGYGNLGDCKSALLAYNVPTPAGYYGSSGGQLETACLLYSAYLTPNDFVKTPSEQYVNVTAANIYCPS